MLLEDENAEAVRLLVDELAGLEGPDTSESCDISKVR